MKNTGNAFVIETGSSIFFKRNLPSAFAPGSRFMMLFAALCTAGLSACGGGGGGGPAANSQASVSLPPTASLSGSVVDKNGAPVAGVTISAYHTNNHTTATAVTDASGAYSITGLPAGSYSDYAVFAQKAGFGFYPAISGAGNDVEKMDFNGLYRTVIHFPSLSAQNVAGNNFTAYRPGDKTASLPRTGQTASYANGDDAWAHQGVAWPGTRFTDNSDGTVTDHLTGLVWLKNADCLGPMIWSAALTAAHQLASGACGLSDGSTAGQWRMPNANELESMVDVSQANPAVSAGSPFTGVNLLNAYWSSTTYNALSSNAMAIRFTDGRWINGVVNAGGGSFDNAKASVANSLWAVRSGGAGAVQLLATGVYNGIGGGSFGLNDDASLQLGAVLTSPRFIDNGNGTLSDTVTGLTWLKQADCIRQTWAGAVAAVNALASGQCGLTDGSTVGQWRMPNRQEMLSLSDRAPTFPQAEYLNGQYQGNGTVNGPAIFTRFIVADYYWTSTTDAADTTQAWTLYSCDFGVYDIPKTNMQYALAVR